MALALALAAAAAAVGWAAASVLAPVSDPLEDSAYTHVSVESGAVGASVELNAVARWSFTDAGTNAATGVVTAVVVSPGDEVAQGAVLYRVDERPVVVAEGSVPAFRPISADDEGEDVAQLQRMLDATGHPPGAADGRAGPSTIAAIRSWQRSLGVPDTGTVALGSVIFVPELPARVSLDPDAISRGASLTGGEEAVRALPAAPAFHVPVTDSQAATMPTGTAVELAAPEGGSWRAVVAEHVANEDSGAVDVVLAPAGNAPICGSECGRIPVAGETLLGARVVTVAEVEGLVVPSAALLTRAGGEVGVIDARGSFHPVTEVASARGMSVIEGVEAGTRVRVPATEESP